MSTKEMYIFCENTVIAAFQNAICGLSKIPRETSKNYHNPCHPDISILSFLSSALPPQSQHQKKEIRSTDCIFQVCFKLATITASLV